MVKKILQLLLLVFVVFALVSCSANESNNSTLEPVKKEQFTIIYDANGGQLDKEFDVYYEGDKLSLPTPVRENTIFLGWIDVSTQKIVDNDTIVKTGMVLKASWSHYNLIYLNDDGSILHTERYTSVQETVDLDIKPNNVEGKTFVRWDFEFGKILNSDVTVKPIFDDLTINITFVPNDNGLTNMTFQTKYNSNVSFPKIQSVGKNFIGWFDGLNKDANQISDDTVFKSDTTLYGRWDKYIIEYLDGENEIYRETFVNAYEKLLPLDYGPKGNKCEKFEKWNIDESTIVSTDLTITPIFSQNEFDHNYDEWEIVKDSEYDKEGIKKHKCLDCGTVDAEVIEKKKGLIFSKVRENNETYYTVKGDIDYLNKNKETSVRIPGQYDNIKVKYVEENGFKGTEYLIDVIFDEGIESIKDYAFANTKVCNIKFSNSIKEIGKYAFYKTEISYLTIPYSVVLIDQYAFSECIKLYELNLGDGPIVIEENAFKDSYMLYYIKMHKGIGEIKGLAFEGCSNLQKIDFFGTSEDYNNVNIDLLGNDVFNQVEVNCLFK